MQGNGGKVNAIGAAGMLALLLALDAYTAKTAGVAALKALYVPAHATLASILPTMGRVLSVGSAAVAMDRAVSSWRANRSTRALWPAAATILLSPFFAAHVQPILLGLLPVEAKTLKEVATWAGVFLLADSTY